MKEIKTVRPNGFSVVSTFSGAGGSCIGYRMAGFKVIWANEFAPHAQASYKANSDSFLDARDVKSIKSQEILSKIGLKKGELDLFDGSPPCQAFSTAGKREKGWGTDKKYSHGAAQKNETLFSEYVRLLRGLMPKVFVAENVSGLAKGTCKGWFIEILRDLKESGYAVECRLLDAQWLGVPQQRQRLIFVGVREDLAKRFGVKPEFPKPLPYRYSVRDALSRILNVVQDSRGQFAVQKNGGDRPLFSIKAGSSSHIKVESARRVEVFHASGGYARTETLDRPSPAVTATQCRMTVEWPNKGFRGGTKSGLDEPLPSVQAAAGVTGGTGGTVLSDGTEQRKFTIAEVKRICAFPDDFVLTGSYSQQWSCLGNSVPPLMMRAVAETIRDKILRRLR